MSCPRTNSLERWLYPKNIQLQPIRIPIVRLSRDSHSHLHRSFDSNQQSKPIVFQAQHRGHSPARDNSSETQSIRIVMPCTVIPTQRLIIKRQLSEPKRPKHIVIDRQVQKRDEEIIANTPIKQLDSLLDQVPKQRPKQLYNRLLEKRNKLNMHQPLPTAGFFRK